MNPTLQLNCYWIKQPETADEFDRAIEILHAQQLPEMTPQILKRCSPSRVRPCAPEH